MWWIFTHGKSGGSKSVASHMRCSSFLYLALRAGGAFPRPAKRAERTVIDSSSFTILMNDQNARPFLSPLPPPFPSLSTT